jgi:regulator of protease activity HflC (stomatin/prohibitin superfamily)
MAGPQSKLTVERELHVLNGWLALLLVVLWFIGAVAVLVSTAAALGPQGAGLSPGIAAARFLGAFLMIGLGIFLCFGFFTLEPNEARVLILFGEYKGTARRSGFHWANPLYARNRGVVPGSTPVPKKVKLGPLSVSDGTVTQPKLKTKLSLRAHNFNSETLKVNDKRGNPVEIAAVVVWRVEDTAQAVFDVEDYESYIHVQSEAAIRSIASLYSYDHGEENELTLRGGGDEVAHALKKELEVRLAKAGVVVEEARLTHLAYAPEIAPAMLRRQQAEAVIAAREKIVLGAVSMVEMALDELARKDVVKLDEERKAAMVSNLLVVLCGTEEASPVINTGTLYS